MISSRELGMSLCRLDLLKPEGLIQDKLMKENLGFPVRSSGSDFNRGTIRLRCLDHRSHNYTKTLKNSNTDLSYLAWSPEEFSHLRKFRARVNATIEVESYIKLLCQCNSALNPSKLHIKGVAPLSNRKTIVVGAEPEMTALIKKREGRFCFLMTEVILCNFGGGQIQP